MRKSIPKTYNGQNFGVIK